MIVENIDSEYLLVETFSDLDTKTSVQGSSTGQVLSHRNT